jgi:protein ImuB
MKRFLALYLPVPDLKLLRTIAERCLKITPFVGVEHDLKKHDLESSLLKRGLILDISGTNLLYPSEIKLAQKIKYKLSQDGIEASIAAAPTVGAAWAFSRFNKKRVYIQHGSLMKALSPLPLEALRISPAETLSLVETGLQNLEDLFSLPFKDIGRRFGPLVFKRLNQILGRIEEPLRLLKLSKTITVKRQFETPISNKQTVSLWANYLIQDLFKKLQAIVMTAGSYELFFLLENDMPITRNISLGLASGNFSHIASVIGTSIESLSFSHSVKMIKITALDLIQPIKSQIEISDPKGCEFEIGKSLNEYLNLLGQKIGRQNITRPYFLDSYIPENSYNFLPINKDQNYSLNGHMQDRPSLIFPKPEKLTAISMLPDKAPSLLNLNGEKLKIIKGFGPERINNEWWNSTLREANFYRDYYKVLDEKGRWLWLYRESGTLDWFLQGIWA